MAICIPRKAALFWNSKWLRMSSYSVLSCNALQHEDSKLAYGSMAGSKDALHSSVCSTCECSDTKSRDLTCNKKCTYTKKGCLIPCAVCSAHEIILTSTDMCTDMKVIGSTKDWPYFALHHGFSISKDVYLSHVLPSSHAMARGPRRTYEGFLRNMVHHIRAHSTDAEANTQCCPCGNYKSEKGFLICPLCYTIQAPNPAITFFQIFDQDEKFELDLKDLEVKYKRLMKKLHPDLSHGKSMEEKENYARLSALVTTAYNELLKPVSRATYMLKLRGVHVEDEGTVTDSELIMEVMEIRETFQSSPDRKTLEQLHKTAMTRMGEWSEAFKSALKDGDDTKAVGALQRMSYFGRVCEDIGRELL